MPNDAAETQLATLEADSSTVALLNKSEIDQQIATARKYPRSISGFRSTVLALATLNETTAEECSYALPRDGKTIIGPSARFAEIVAYAWKNCRSGARVIDDRGEYIVAQGVFIDLEQNVAITYEVQRRIVNKKGVRFNADMIGVTANAARSIALRNAVFKGVPKAMWADLWEQARKVAVGDVTTLANKRARVIAKLAPYGVTQEMALAKLGRRTVEEVTLEDIEVLIGLGTAVKDGDTTPEQAFAPESSPIQMPEARTETLAEEALRKAGTALKPSVDAIRERPQPAQSGQQAAPAESQATTVAGNIVDRASGEILAPAEATFTPSTAGQPQGADPSQGEPIAGNPGGDLLDAAIKADPMAGKRLASKAQRDMIVKVASHKGLTEPELDALLVERFAFTLATLPTILVNEAIQFVNGIK